jgi:site-specific DNA recombinase
MSTAAIYARVSSDRQRQEQTIASQLAALDELAQSRGYAVPREWVFRDEGYSGSSLIRPGLERLRDLAAEGLLQAVLIYSPDRLSRKYAYQVLLMEEFARRGTEVIFARAPQGETPEDQLLVQFQGMIAEYERAQIVERTRRGKKHRAKLGMVNVLSGAPYGYRYVKKSEGAPARYEVIEREAAVVREVYRQYTEEGDSIGEITRSLNHRRIATRTGKEHWDRSTIWGMLRNPAYCGRACFGKTEVAERRIVTRRLRRRGGFSPRCSSNRTRPVEQWTPIPVPALIDERTFELARERLEENKRFAARNTKEPTLLQGLLVCSRCGYAYYRTSTRTSKRKIYYYRCLGSDSYRHLTPTVCENRPIRQDYLDELVWKQVVGLLEDPNLIRVEIDRRLQQMRQSNPAQIKRDQLHKELAHVSQAAQRLVDAYQEDLLSLEELRRRMPPLKKRETALQSDIRALEAASVDHERYLQVVHDLESFTMRLRATAEKMDVRERQRVLRLIVKEVLVGPESLTIRHCIPGKPSSVPSSSPGYLLCRWSPFRPVVQYLLRPAGSGTGETGPQFQPLRG